MTDQEKQDQVAAEAHADLWQMRKLGNGESNPVWGVEASAYLAGMNDERSRVKTPPSAGADAEAAAEEYSSDASLREHGDVKPAFLAGDAHATAREAARAMKLLAYVKELVDQYASIPIDLDMARGKEILKLYEATK
jgi:hypothetical protein